MAISTSLYESLLSNQMVNPYERNYMTQEQALRSQQHMNAYAEILRAQQAAQIAANPEPNPVLLLLE
ncbi:hypothetical protein D3C85_1941810 [compost metagenome]